MLVVHASDILASPTVSENSSDRSVSHSKTVDLDQQQTALDRAQRLKDAYNRALAEKLEPEKSAPTEAHSKQIQNNHTPAQDLHLRPAGEIRQIVDKQIDAENRQKEIERAKALNEAAESRARQLARDLEQEKGGRER